MSPLTQGRGLKPQRGSETTMGEGVAPHTGAWIETAGVSVNFKVKEVAPHTGAWIETLLMMMAKIMNRRPSHRGVD